MQTLKAKRVESKKEWQPRGLYIVSAIFVATLLISNITAQKIFLLGPFVFTAGILVFPISYIFGDILTEVYGFERTRNIIYLGFILNVFMSMYIWVTIQLTPAPGWNLQNEYSIIFSFVPRIVIASLFAYLAGELVNSLIISKLKIKTSGRFLWLRLIISTFFGQFVDSVVFIIVGFGGILSSSMLISACISAWLFKTVYEILISPATYIIINKLKAIEGFDHFDKNNKISLL